MDFESQLRLERDAEDVQSALEAAGGRLIRRDDDPVGLYWAEIKPSAPDTKAFIARIQWTIYPGRQPSVLFTPEAGGKTTSPGGWPAAPGYRVGLDICKPFTAEGLTVHPEWSNGPYAWRSEGNPFLYIIEIVQGDIDRVAGARSA